MENLNFEALVTCCNHLGGVYHIKFEENGYNLTKILDGHYTGVAKYGDHFVLVSAGFQSLILDHEFNRFVNLDLGFWDLHGIFIDQNTAFIVETFRNAIGIYNLPDLTRTDEIRFAAADHDVHHINDIYKVGDRLFISMFSFEEAWRDHNGPSGVIVEYCLKKNTVESICHNRLSKPHSVNFHDSDLFYCNSSKSEVRKGEEVIFRASSFTRGLAFKDQYIFVGQSLNRYAQGNKGQCGIHVLDLMENANEFIPLPSEEVYGILIY